MATFRIHEDDFTVKNTKMEVEYSSNSQMPQKRAILKEINVPTKRLPLKQHNNQIIKPNNVMVKRISTTQIQVNPKVQVSVKEELQAITKGNENKEQNSSDPVLDLNIFQNKENNDRSNVDTTDFFHILKDQIYFATSIYQEHIYKYLLHLERSLKRPKFGYMDKQPELSFKMRTILIDWLSSVAEEYSLHPQTLHLAVHYLDTFLSRMSVVKQKFQLVGTAAMLIAAKYEEIYPPESKEFTYLTADTYTVKQLRRMEQLILKVLQFDLCPPTSFAFIIHLAAALNLPKKTTLLAMYFSELVLLEGEDYLQYFPSQLAFAAIALARHTLQEQDVWPVQLQSVTGYSLKQLSPLIKRQHQSFTDSPNREQKAIQDKYKTVRYGRVSLMKPRCLDLSNPED